MNNKCLLVFVGDRHSPKMEPNAPAFVGARSEPRLKEWIDYITEGVNNYILVNSYRAEDTKKIRDYAALVDWRHSHRTPGMPIFIALGNTASLRLTKMKIRHFKLPHPSGLNRLINNKEYILRQLNICKRYILSLQ